MNNYVYTTLLGTDEYVYGVLGLYFSLQKSGAQYPFKAMVVDTVSQNTLDILDNNNVPYTIIEDTPFENTDIWYTYRTTLNKFQCLAWEEYDKVLYFDADILVVQNPDAIFNLSAPATAVDITELNQDDAYLMGNAMLFAPNTHLWNEIRKLSTSVSVNTDEQIINNLLKPKIHFNHFIWYPYVMHTYSLFSSPYNVKYWVSFNFNSPARIPALRAFIDNLNDYIYTPDPEKINNWPLEPPTEEEPIDLVDLDNIILPIEDYSVIPTLEYRFIRKPEL